MGIWQLEGTRATSHTLARSSIDMEVDPFTIRYQRKQKKREEFKPVLRALVEGLASLVDGQRCFADEFGLSYGRVFDDDLEFFKGKDTCNVIAEWLRGGEEGAEHLKQLFENLAQHQVALVETFDEVASESAFMSKQKKSKLINRYGIDAKTDSSKAKHKRQHDSDIHRQLMMTLFVARYAKAREQMRVDVESGRKERETGSEAVKL
jgi:hypothetical protein